MMAVKNHQGYNTGSGFGIQRIYRFKRLIAQFKKWQPLKIY